MPPPFSIPSILRCHGGGEELETLMGMGMNVAICKAGLYWDLRKKHNLEEMMAPGSAERGDLFDDVYIDF